LDNKVYVLSQIIISSRTFPGNYEQLFVPTAHRINCVRRASLPIETKHPWSLLGSWGKTTEKQWG